MSNQPPTPPEQLQSLEIPLTPRNRACAILFVLLVVIGGITLGRATSGWLIGRLTEAGLITDPAAMLAKIPISELPGPPRGEPLEFRLTADNSRQMIAHNDPAQERWADLAGNFYSAEFISSFSYERPAPATPAETPAEVPAETPAETPAAPAVAPDADAAPAAPAAAVTPAVAAPAPDNATPPYVRVAYNASGQTFAGRLEAHGLKPNFAYQMKLRGSYDIDRDSFTIIGALGRWRLPGRETNFTDEDFKQYPHKNLVEAYILFDYFVTDKDGNAVRDFALDSSLHVLWNASRQRPPKNLVESHLVPFTVDASNPAVYARPKAGPVTQNLWAEREVIRYDSPTSGVSLPPTTYKALFVLVEESFHSSEADGGWWPTVYALPVQFDIVY